MVSGDALHVVVVDDEGSVTGIQGNILEKHLSLSKAVDSVSSVNSPQKDLVSRLHWQISPKISSLLAIHQAQQIRIQRHCTKTVGLLLQLVLTESFTQITTAGGLWGQMHRMYSLQLVM